jgi:uncharacterized protein YoxC
VLVLVVYLIGIIIALWRAGNHLKELAGGLQKIENDTRPLTGHLTTINGALDQLHGGLSSVNKHLASIAGVLKL